MALKFLSSSFLPICKIDQSAFLFLFSLIYFFRFLPPPPRSALLSFLSSLISSCFMHFTFHFVYIVSPSFFLFFLSFINFHFLPFYVLIVSLICYFHFHFSSLHVFPLSPVLCLRNVVLLFTIPFFLTLSIYFIFHFF